MVHNPLITPFAILRDISIPKIHIYGHIHIACYFAISSPPPPPQFCKAGEMDTFYACILAGTILIFLSYKYEGYKQAPVQNSSHH